VLHRRWDDLDSFLSKYDTPNTGTTTRPNTATSTSSLFNITSLNSTHTSTIRSTTTTTLPLALPVLEEDRFQLSVGKLLLCLQKRDKGVFEEVLSSARAQVCIY